MSPDDGVPAAALPREDALVRLPSRIAFLGFGLIGGSIARSLREAGSPSEFVAWTPDGTGPRHGVELELLDAAAPDPGSAVDGAGLVVLAAPPLAVLELLDELGGPLRGRLSGGATVTDVASTKARIMAVASRRRLPFIGGHPMAGREVTGMPGSRGDLFTGRPWIVVPGRGAIDEDIAVVEALAVAVGARPMRMSAADHDAAVAAISHLPLVVAAALVEAVAGAGRDWRQVRELAASGWADMTRLARGSPEMGAGILATNAAEVASRLRAFRDVVDGWIDRLEGGDAGTREVDVAELRRALDAAHAALEGDRAGGDT